MDRSDGRDDVEGEVGAEPCAFLFDNSVEGVPEPQLAWFTG